MECLYQQNGYVDLNVIAGNENDELFKVLYNYNYRTIAINQTVDLTVTEKKKKKSGQEDVIPEPIEIKIPDDLVKSQDRKNRLCVLRRITIKFADQAEWYRVSKSHNVTKYHIVAAIPTNMTALQHCVSMNSIDLISFEPETRPEWRINRKVYNMAVNRCMYFEVNYANSILDNTCCKNNIQISQSYKAMGKSKNFIVTSGTSNPFLIRSPFDVENLCYVYGLDCLQSKQAICVHPKALLHRAMVRSQGVTPFKVAHTVDDKEVDSELEDEEMLEMDLTT